MYVSTGEWENLINKVHEGKNKKSDYTTKQWQTLIDEDLLDELKNGKLVEGNK